MTITLPVGLQPKSDGLQPAKDTLLIPLVPKIRGSSTGPFFTTWVLWPEGQTPSYTFRVKATGSMHPLVRMLLVAMPGAPSSVLATSLQIEDLRESLSSVKSGGRFPSVFEKPPQII